jgi:glyoxylase-like metal-dependent hydrolase (beta-lactamase superfamily II)
MSDSKPVPGRRNFITSVIGGVAGIALMGETRTAAFAKTRATAIQATSLGDGLTLIEGAGGNVVMLTGADGVLMIDGGLPERSAELLKLVAHESGKQPIRVMFNTHWHWDHTGSNERVGKLGARIIAHENTKLWLGAGFFVEWQNRAYKPRPPQALPTETFYTSGQLNFGNEQIQYGHLPRAHTDGDIYLFFPGRNILVAGDLLSVGAYPILDYSTGGWIGGMMDASKALLDLSNEQTRIIPGTGPVQTRADLQAQYDMLATMKDRLVGLLKKGMGADDMIAAAATQEFDARWGDPKLFVSNAYRGLWGHVRSLGGIV